MKRLSLIAVALLGVTALAATQYTRILNLRVSGLTLLGSNSDGDAIDKSLVADMDYDFASATIVCNDTPAQTVTGVRVGDTCVVGVGPRDGGTAIFTDNSVFTAFVSAADAVKLRHCPVGTAANPVDAGYVVRCFSAP